jgi:D-arabinose 1-dehydrogenase-like Zn-dependent alcohol dehydrogenase
MKAVRLLEYGGQLVFDDVPTPKIARDEVLVKVKSTAANHLDLVKASGTARQILPMDLPWIPGHDFRGSSNRLAVTLRGMREVMQCSARTESAAPTRSI